jgi:hypothetical protein
MSGQPNNAPGEGPPEPQRQPLGYAPGHRVSRGTRVGQVIAGTLMAVFVFLGIAFGAPFVVGQIGMLLGPLAAIALLVPLALKLRRNTLYRPWVAGIWIGLGIGLLTDGLCWAFMTGMEH